MALTYAHSTIFYFMFIFLLVFFFAEKCIVIKRTLNQRCLPGFSLVRLLKSTDLCFKYTSIQYRNAIHYHSPRLQTQTLFCNSGGNRHPYGIAAAKAVEEQQQANNNNKNIALIGIFISTAIHSKNYSGLL